jgi:hypothetical protein
MKNRPVRTGMCRLPAGHTFPVLVHRISQYETRSSRYRSRTDVRSLAPSLQNLTGKRSLTYRIAPFIVELFTAGRLNRSPRRSHPGTLCRQSAAPHASRVERTRPRQARTPRTGFAPALPAAMHCSGEGSPVRSLHQHDLFRLHVTKEVFPHRPIFPTFDCQ